MVLAEPGDRIRQRRAAAVRHIEARPDRRQPRRPRALAVRDLLAPWREADIGDLVFVPGHVMMIIGHIDGEPWVIHDTAGTYLRGEDGGVHRAALNGVVVTPLTPLLADAEGVPMVDRITRIQRVR